MIWCIEPAFGDFCEGHRSSKVDVNLCKVFLREASQLQDESAQGHGLKSVLASSVG